MKKIFLLLIAFYCCSIFSQDVLPNLRKAFASKDSADYYFKIAKKNIKTKKNQADYDYFKHNVCGNRLIIDSALYYGYKAINQYKQLKSSAEIAKINIKFSRIYNEKGEYEKSIYCLLESLKIGEKLKNDTLISKSLISISYSNHDFDEYTKGVFYGKKAFDYTRKMKMKDVSLIAHSLNAIAINFDDDKKPDSALFYHKKVFDFVKGKDTLLAQQTYNNIGNTLVKQNEFLEAKKWLVSAANINETLDPVLQADIYYYNKATIDTNLGKISYKTNQNNAAENYFKTAFISATKANNIEKLRDYYQQQYLFNLQKKDFEKAVDFQSKYTSYADTIYSEDRVQQFSELETKYQTEKKEKLLLVKEAEAKSRNTTILILSLLAGLIALFAFLIYRTQKTKAIKKQHEFELNQAFLKIENQNKLQEQRLEISRDLHDNIGAQLTFITSSVENIKHGFDLKDEKLTSKLSNISDFTKDTIVELRDTIWAMNNNEISFEELKIRIINFIDKAKDSSQIDFNFEIDQKLNNYKLSSLEGMNIFRTIQEAVNNALKYSKANKIDISANKIDQKAVISIKDNGIGFDQNTIEPGNGLVNIKKRIQEISGEFGLESSEGKGTLIVVKLGLTNENHL